RNRGLGTPEAVCSPRKAWREPPATADGLRRGPILHLDVLAEPVGGMFGSMTFPIHRSRRLRRSDTIRNMVRETRLAPADLIYPLFVVEGRGVRRPVQTMPGVFNLSVENAVEEARKAQALGIPAVILFGVPDAKDAKGSGAYTSDGIVQRAIGAIKSA